MSFFKVIILILLCLPALALECSNKLPAVSLLNKKLTPLWAQEYIGADLVKNELRTMGLKKVDVAIYDLGFEEDYINLTEDIEVPHQLNGRRRMRAHHGTSVVNILNGPYGITEQMNLMSLGRINYKFMYSYLWNQYVKKDRFPSIISNSLGWGNSIDVSEVVQRAHEKNTLWFLASGNDFPNEVSKVERESKALLVGSFSASGLTSLDAQIHPSLLVLAPANSELATIDGYGKHSLFGSSSGATPMVVGIVTGIRSLIPTINRDQIFKIIQGTAYKSAENKMGFKKMPGLFNGYKAFKVAKRITDKCDGLSSDCIDRLLLDESTFKFKTSEVIKCEEIKNRSCLEQGNILKKMRANTFLGSSEQAKELSCAYETIGYAKNAEYYSFITKGKVDLIELEEVARKSVNSNVFNMSALRYQRYFSSGYRDFIKDHKQINEYRKVELLKAIMVP